MIPAGATMRDRLGARVAVAAAGVINRSIAGLRDVMFHGAGSPSQVRRILVYRVGNVGDIVVIVPALIALREAYPDAHISFLTSPGPVGRIGARELLRAAPYLDELIEYSSEQARSIIGPLQLLARIRETKPDLVIAMESPLYQFGRVVRDLMFCRLTGAQWATGFEVAAFRPLALSLARVHDRVEGELARQLRLVRDVGADSTSVRFEFGLPSPADRKRIDAWTNNRVLVAICPGGKQEGHRWPTDRFGEIARRLRERYRVDIVAIGGRNERELCDRVLEAAGGGINTAGELSLPGTASLLSRARLLVTNDTGPMHLAAGVGCRVVAIFGSRDFVGRWYPYGEGHEVFRAVQACEVCMLNDRHPPHCVQTITLEEVWKGCERVAVRAGLPTFDTSSSITDRAGE